MTREHRLDLDRIDILAAAHDHVLEPIDDMDIARLVHPADVARMHPAAAQRRGGFLRPVPIAEHHALAARHDFAVGPDGDLLIMLVDDPQLDGHRRPAGGTDTLARRVQRTVIGGPEQRGDRRQLGHAVSLDETTPRQGLDQPVHQSGGDRGGTIDDPFDAAEVMVREGGMIEQRLDHRRHQKQVGDAVGGHRAHDCLGVETGHENMYRTPQHRSDQARDRSDMEQRRGMHHACARSAIGGTGISKCRCHHRPVGQHDALGLARRSAGIEDSGQVVAAAQMFFGRLGRKQPRLIVRRAGNEDRLDAGRETAQFGRMPQMLLVDDENPRVAVRQRIGDLAQRPTQVDRVDHAARPPGAQHIVEKVVAIGGQHPHAAARFEPGFMQDAGKAAHTLADLAPGPNTPRIDRRHSPRRFPKRPVKWLR